MALLPNASKYTIILEPRWAEVGANWSKLGRSWGQCCGHVGSKWCIWTILGRSAARANYYSPVRSFSAKMPPPMLYQSDRSVRLYASQLNYHASARSVQAGCRHCKLQSIGTMLYDVKLCKALGMQGRFLKSDRQGISTRQIN